MGQCGQSRPYLDNSSNNKVTNQFPLLDGSIRDIELLDNMLIACSDNPTVKTYNFLNVLQGNCDSLAEYNGHSKGVNRVSNFDKYCTYI